MPPKAAPDPEVDKTHPLLDWAHGEAVSLPVVSPSNPSPPALDAQRWPDWIRQAPNTTLFTQQNLNRKQGHLPYFYRAFTFVLFFVHEVFFHHIYPRVVCPGCNSSDKVKPKGWCEGLRRVASSHGTFFAYGRRYVCDGGCPGFSIFNEKLIKSLPDCIVNQLPFVLTRGRHSSFRDGPAWTRSRQRHVYPRVLEKHAWDEHEKVCVVIQIQTRLSPNVPLRLFFTRKLHLYY